MKRIIALILLPTVLSGNHLCAQSASTGLFLDSGSFTLMNNELTPLSGGVEAVVGDGDVIQFGYYTNATSSNLFSGTWVPLTGNGGANSAFNTTSIGDNPDTVGAGNTNGTFAFSSNGSTPSDTYINFIQGSSTSGVSLPSSGQIMAVRFYNGTSVANSTYYGAASDASWEWVAPLYPIPESMTFGLDNSVSWFNNQVGYTGTIIDVPEPPASSLFGLCFGVLAFVYWRRRHRRMP